MADLDFSVNADTSGATASLRRLESTVGSMTSTLGKLGVALAGAFTFREINSISSRFEDLRTTLQLLYRDAEVGSAAFDDIKKFAQSSIFSVEDLTETVVKLKSAGLEPTVALLRLFGDVSSVAADSVGALQAITDLYSRTTAGGLGLEDLNRLADRGIPVFDILSKRLGITRLQVSEFGKSAEGAAIILGALEDGLQEAFGGASAMRANNVSQSMSQFGDAVSNAADSLGTSGLNKGLSDFFKAATDLLTSLTPLIEVIGKGLGAALTILAENIKFVVALVSGFLVGSIAKTLVVMARWVGITAVLTKSWQILATVLSASPIGRIASVLTAGAAAFGFFSTATDETTQATDELVKSANQLADSNGFKVFKDGTLGSGAKNLRGEIQKLNEPLIRFNAEMAAIVTNFQRFNDETRRGIALETQLIGSTKELSEIRRAEADISREAARQIADLTTEKSKLTAQELKEGRAGIIDKTIEKIKQQAEIEKTATAEAISANEARQRSRQAELFGIQSQIDLQNNLQEVQNRIATLTMTEIEKKYYDIEQAAQASARAAVRAEEARIGRPLNIQEQKAFYDAATAGVKQLQDAERARFEESRTWNTGWKNAFNEYKENATNAALAAESIFKRATTGMEDAIVSFAKTGKFEFAGFLNSILEELLRSQVRQLLAQLFGNSSGSGGPSIFGATRNLLGFANGGVIPTNGPVIVGERGPEVLSGAAGRVVTPNNQIGGGSVTYNINAVDALSFKQMIAADPTFLFAITEQGRRKLPGAR
jgi:lambda family phage tail tape measure protein